MLNPTPAQQAALDVLRALPPKELFDLRDAFLDLVRVAEYPQVTIRTDDDGQVVLGVPEGFFSSGADEFLLEDLKVIDVSERWTSHPDVDFEERTFQWCYDSRADYDGLVYTFDGTHPVRLPEGWEER